MLESVHPIYKLIGIELSLQHLSYALSDWLVFRVVFSDAFSKWSTEGCRRIEGTTEYSVCECDHMTNFAVLLDVTGVSEAITEEHELSLRIITYAGCAISIICLLLSWLTFQFLK